MISRCMGTTQANRTLEVEYPQALTTALLSSLSTSSTPIRYIHLSGAATERDQSANLWFKSDMRKMKGETESYLLAIPGKEKLWSTLVVKAAFVVQPTLTSPRDLVGWLTGDKSSIKVDELAAAMIDAAVSGWGDDVAMTWGDNKMVVDNGRKRLQEERDEFNTTVG